MAKVDFRVMRNGYDRYAVDDAINNYEEKLLSLNKQVDLYTKEIERLKEELNNSRNDYLKLSNEIDIREKACEDISRLALKEANSLIESANKNADHIVREALSTARLILTELAKLSSDSMDVRSDMKDKLIKLMDALEEFNIPRLPDLRWLNEAKKEYDEQDMQ